MDSEKSEKPRKKKETIAIVLFTIVLILIGGVSGHYISNYIVNYISTKKMIEEKQMLDLKLSKFQYNKKLFIDNIERRYKDLQFLIGQEETMAALRLIDDFKRFEVIDYKDVAKLYKQLTIQFLVETTTKIPQNDLLGNFEMYNYLYELDPESTEYSYKNAFYRNKLFDLIDLQKDPNYVKQCQIQIVRSKFYDFYEFASYEAELKNLSGVDLKDLEIMILWVDLNDRITISKLEIGEEVFLGDDSFVISDVAEQSIDIKVAKLFFKNSDGEILETCR